MTTEWTMLCKRTEYPKLGYIIFKLKQMGVPCRFNGRSFHADHILEVDANRISDAWKVLDDKPHIGGKKRRKSLDDIPDDFPPFYPYMNELPSDYAGERS